MNKMNVLSHGIKMNEIVICMRNSISTNVFVSGLYILQIEEIKIASDSKNRLQFIIVKQ